MNISKILLSSALLSACLYMDFCASPIWTRPLDFHFQQPAHHRLLRSVNCSSGADYSAFYCNPETFCFFHLKFQNARCPFPFNGSFDDCKRCDSSDESALVRFLCCYVLYPDYYCPSDCNGGSERNCFYISVSATLKKTFPIADLLPFCSHLSGRSLPVLRCSATIRRLPECQNVPFICCVC